MNDQYKYGVTAVTPELRNSWNRGRTINPHAVFFGTRIQVANLEYSIKIKLNRVNEYFDSIQQFDSIYRSVMMDLTKNSFIIKI